MAIKKIALDLQNLIRTGKILEDLRKLQYRNSLITIEHDAKRIAMTMWGATTNYANNKKDKTLAEFLKDNEADVKKAMIKAAEDVFVNYTNVAKQHKKQGYTVHNNVDRMKKASGYIGSLSGPRRKNPGKHVLIGNKVLGETGEQRSPFAGGGHTITCQYSGSLSKRDRDAMDRRMYNFAFRKVIKGQGLRSMTKYSSDYNMAEDLVTYDMSKPDHGTKNNLGKLHGPTASKYQGQDTPFGNDTSVPVVGITERLKELYKNPKLAKVAAENTQYNTAMDDFLMGLDLEFKIDQDKISNIVKNQKEIDIKMSLGDVTTGSLQQKEMDHADAQNVRKVLRKIAADLLSNNSDPDYQSSSSFKEDYQRTVPGIVVDKLIKKDGTPDMRFKANKALIQKSKRKQRKRSNTNTNFSLKGSSKKRTLKAPTIAASALRVKSSKKAKEGTTSPVALKELIQAQLAERLLNNMQAPALRNRTGRFRRSAQVENVIVGPKGGTEVQYSYMKMPYQTFEPGYAQGSTDRDPRRLIGGTIREIATELTGKKFIRTRSI